LPFNNIDLYMVRRLMFMFAIKMIAIDAVVTGAWCLDSDRAYCLLMRLFRIVYYYYFITYHWWLI